jgi:hypothetical protein
VEKLEIVGNAKISGTVNSTSYNAMPSPSNGNEASVRAGRAVVGFGPGLNANAEAAFLNGGNLNLSAGGAGHFGRGGNISLNAGDAFDTGSIGGSILLTAGGYSNWTRGYIGFLIGGSYSAGASIERMRVAGNGNVGIGTQDPQSLLHVNGYIQLALTTGEPPATDCDEAIERGRMKIDSAGGGLYICVDTGWVAK